MNLKVETEENFANDFNRIAPVDLANRLALKDLADARIELNSPVGREFMARVRQFGIMCVNPPLTEKKTQVAR